MRSEGLSLGLVLLCLLRVQAKPLGTAEPDASKVAGTWYITAMASDSKTYLEKKDQLKMAMANIEVLGDGDLNVSFAIPTAGSGQQQLGAVPPQRMGQDPTITTFPAEPVSPQKLRARVRACIIPRCQPKYPLCQGPERCMKFSSIYKPTGNPDEYHSSDRGNKTVQLVNTDSSSYMVVFATREKNGKKLKMLRLYSRAQQVRPKIISLFKRFAKQYGFTDETIWILPTQEECQLGEP
uniref:Lipocalin/cytosolic fatty-acid binding domain-containing protein n=1 Tax=Ficedula albicollis TaxID=59894 RepID=A0A803WFU8_FICAL